VCGTLLYFMVDLRPTCCNQFFLLLYMLQQTTRKSLPTDLVQYVVKNDREMVGKRGSITWSDSMKLNSPILIVRLRTT
jgi:hypothetical protein